MTNSPRIQTIVFDLGGVLVDWNPRYLYRKLLPTEDAIEDFLTNVATSDWNEEQDAGRSLADGTEWLVNKHPEQEELIRAFYGRWPEMLGGPIEGTVLILQELLKRNTHPIYALTNWSAETFPIALELYDFLGWFKGTLVSGAEGIRKPNPDFFNLLTSRYGFELNSAIFIDDSLRNVKGAQAVGMQALHFESPEKLRADLEALDLL